MNPGISLKLNRKGWFISKLFHSLPYISLTERETRSTSKPPSTPKNKQQQKSQLFHSSDLPGQPLPSPSIDSARGAKCRPLRSLAARRPRRRSPRRWPPRGRGRGRSARLPLAFSRPRQKKNTYERHVDPCFLGVFRFLRCALNCMGVVLCFVFLRLPLKMKDFLLVSPANQPL